MIFSVVGCKLLEIKRLQCNRERNRETQLLQLIDNEVYMAEQSIATQK